MGINYRSIPHLVKNPIGFFGLLTMVFDITAGVVLTKGLTHLTQPEERLPLIWFIIGFPILILIVFTILVWIKPTHLYAPNDYSDSSMFVKATQSQISIEQSREAAYLYKTEHKSRNNHLIKGFRSNPYELKIKVKTAESIGLSAFKNKYNLLVHPNLTIKSIEGNLIYLDGVANTTDAYYLIEVKLLPIRGWRGSVERGVNTLRLAGTVANINSNASMRFVLSLVSQTDNAEFKERVLNYVAEIAPEIESIYSLYKEEGELKDDMEERVKESHR